MHILALGHYEYISGPLASFIYNGLRTDLLHPGDVIVVADDDVVVVVVLDEVQIILFPERTRYHLLLQKEFLQELVTDALREVAVDEVHEADSRPSVVAYLRLRREQGLDDGVNDRAQVLTGCFGMLLKEVLGLQDVVFAIFV